MVKGFDMASRYPRRHLKTVHDAPLYVASIYYHPDYADRYTVVFTGPEFAYTQNRRAHSLGLSYYCDSPQGVSMWGEVDAYWLACQSRHRIAWADLPEHVRRHVRARVEDAPCYVLRARRRAAAASASPALA